MPPSSRPATEARESPPPSSGTSTDATGSVRRRQRVDSEIFLPGGPLLSRELSAKPNPKRLKPSAEQLAMNAGFKGKAPELGSRTVPFHPPHMGVKRLVIKNLRTETRTAEVEQYYQQTWDELRDGLQALFADQRPKLPFDKLYRGVEDLCRHKQERELYKLLEEKCEQHLSYKVLEDILSDGNGSNMAMLRSVLKHWKTWNGQAMLIRSTFSYLDRTYLLDEKHLPQINDMTINQFTRMVFSQPRESIKPSPGSMLLEAMCELVDLDRTNDPEFDTTLLKESVMMLNVQGTYLKYFEPEFHNRSVAYFKQFGQDKILSSLKNYILACEKLIEREDHRCIAYNFDSTTRKQLISAAHRILVEEFLDRLLDNADLSKLLADNETESMKALYQLLRLSNLQKRLKEPWRDYIKQTGAGIVEDTERGDDMVVRLLQLRRSLDLMIRDAFSGDEDFLWGLRDSFGDFMNDRKTTASWGSGPSKIGEMIAKHVDLLLRGGLKALPTQLLSDSKDRQAAEQSGQASAADEDAELDRQLDQALELFRFIEGKDAFEAFYKRDLARRLLMGRSASQDAERNMLTKLRGECGSNFTHNLEQMFKDQDLARDEMETYRQWCEGSASGRGGVNLQVMILSAAAWPTYPDVRVNLPPAVAKQLERFDAYYKNKYTGRRLNWKHALAHCLIEAAFPKGTKELSVSAFQAIVLFLFNDVPIDGFLSYEQIAEATGLAGAELIRTLQSLACGKVRVLAKHPKGKDVKTTDTFSINKTFTDPKRRVKINQIQLKETKEENKATHERIAQDRRFETQAAIVRIMKNRKKMTHAELVAEVINITKSRGSVDAAAIKKEIENLIEKDYLERDGSQYEYLA